MLEGKTVILGVSGSIAAYKTAYLASALVKLHADVHVIMTKNAENFINPITFETLTGNKCLTDTFDRDFEFDVKHVSLGQKADIMIIAPASANVIGKMAHGIADDMLTTTVLSATCPIYVSPAMNTKMYEKAIVQENLQKLKENKINVIEPASGYLACGDTGKGKMPEPDILKEYILMEIGADKDLAGKNILISAGPTREAVDPVRFISNHSTGKMGYALSHEAAMRGANVTLVTGPVSFEPPIGIEVINVTSAKEMHDGLMDTYDKADAVIMAAAVADYRPKTVSSEKIKKSDDSAAIELERTDDILMEMGQKKMHQILCGFSMETENVIENSRGKLEKKNLDMIVVNNLRTEGAGFGTDTNVVTIIDKNGENPLPKASKHEVSKKVLDRIAQML